MSGQVKETATLQQLRSRMLSQHIKALESVDLTGSANCTHRISETLQRWGCVTFTNGHNGRYATTVYSLTERGKALLTLVREWQ